MLSLEFYNPTRILLGKGRIAELDQHIGTDARVLVLYGGGSVERNGTLDEVRQALGARHVQYFSGIEPNPAYETLMQAVELVRREQLDYLLAVGGGSVIDGTKFVAAAVSFTGDPWEILLNGGENVTAALPLASVLTLPATGSEMNNGAVITRLADKAKLPMHSDLVFPQFSVLDPTKTFSLPARQVGNGVVDSFVHVIEQYLTVAGNNPVQDRFAEGLLQTLVEIGEQAVQETENEEVRANLMWVACLALNGLIGAGVPQDWSTHLLGHELTALYGLDHAQTLAVILPACCRYDARPSRSSCCNMQRGFGSWRAVLRKSVLTKRLSGRGHSLKRSVLPPGCPVMGLMPAVSSRYCSRWKRTA